MEAVKDHEPKKAQAYKNLKARLIEWKTSKAGAKILAENSGEIPGSAEVTILQKMVNELKSDIVAYGSREDLIEEARIELLYLEPLLPAEPGENEIKEAIDSWTGSFEKSSMGAIVKYVKDTLPGAPGKLVADLVRERIS